MKSSVRGGFGEGEDARGELYRADDAELLAERQRCQALLHAYNDEVDEKSRAALLRKLLGRVGEGSTIQPR